MGRDKRKDKITGLTIDALKSSGETVRLENNVVYLVDLGRSSADFDDEFYPLDYIPTSAPPFKQIYFQVQLGDKELVSTNIASSGVVYRSIHKGKAKFSKKGSLKKFKTRISGYMDWSDEEGVDAFGGSLQAYSPAYKFSPKKTMFADHPDGKEVAGLGFDIYRDGDGLIANHAMIERGAGLSYFRNLGDGKYFFEGWHLDPFDTSLI